ncbi:MAG: VWA domain-containing protein [Chloroflexi bacterium]|nr:MAG: VWA domain-containing protein [Chloroflexota bacterium]MBL1195828.1 VWA domain-containing protein [Chloroflexota bacterium]NOH13120.1 DUF3520 domain-containing protein [Chloroflexota bacterium]
MTPKLTRNLLIAALVFGIVASACGGAAATAEPPVEANVQEEPRYIVEEPAAEEPMEAEEEYYAPLPSATQAVGLDIPNDAPYQDNFFDNYGVNPFLDTEDDRLSTFALDVDTGSYTIARRYLSDGYLPDNDSVRVEEFINYFEQGYDFPPEGQAFAIHMDGGAAPFTESINYQMLRVGIQGYSVLPSERKDVNLTFVIDVSGSMDLENRLELVKDALELLVEQLRPSDIVSIVVYGSQARVVLEPTSGAEAGTILSAINRLQPEGSTNAEAGLQLGYEMNLRGFNAEGINRVILCSDGVANVGNTGAGSIWETIEARASEGITLTTVGFGMGNYNDVLMEQLADNGDGHYAYVDTLNEAERLFEDNLTSTLQVIAMDAKVQVDFNPAVVSRYRLVGFENRAIADEDFRDDTVDAGEVGAGHSVTALYEIKLHPEAVGEVATVYLRWQDPDTREVIELGEIFFSQDLADNFAETSPYFQWTVLVAEFAEVLRESYWAQSSSMAAIMEESQRVSRLLDLNPDVLEFVSLVEVANRLVSAQ